MGIWKHLNFKRKIKRYRIRRKIFERRLRTSPFLRLHLQEYEARSAKRYALLMLFGIATQSMAVGDHYLFPRIFRHHFNNLFDVPAFAGLFTMRLLDKTCDYPKTMGALVLGIGIAHEFVWAKIGGSPLDTDDIGCYLAGLTFFATRHHGYRIHLQRRLKEFPRLPRRLLAAISCGTGGPHTSPGS